MSRAIIKSGFDVTELRKSALAVCIISTITAQAQSQEKELEEELVVHGIRQSLQDAQTLKRDAATVVDVITASDINSLPDKSVAEALSRVPGVAIDRFAASDDPDHFGTEGRNVVIRGLQRVRSEFNGRDVFSARGTGGLNFSDVPAELLKAVEVKKNSTSSMIEGGVAGTVNLVTKKPFDAPGQQIAVRVKANYGDMVEEIAPELSGLYSNRWKSDAGEFGILLNASMAELQSRSDGAGLYNYYQRSPELGNAYIRSDLSDRQILAPLAPSARIQKNERKRKGAVASFQWQSNDERFLTTLEHIHSSAELGWTERAIEHSEQPFAIAENLGGYQVLDDSDGRVFSDNNGLFQSGNLGGAYHSTSSRINYEKSVIDDTSINVEWQMADNVLVVADYQHIESEFDLFFNVGYIRFESDSYIDVSNKRAEIEYYNDSISDPRNTEPSTFWRGAMDHVEKDKGSQDAFTLDADFDLDAWWFERMKMGIRFSERETKIGHSGFNWGNISETWSGQGVTSEIYKIQDTHPELLEVVSFDDFYREGALSGNRDFTFPSLSGLRDMEALDNTLKQAGYNTSSWNALANREGVDPTTLLREQDISSVEEKRNSAYIQFDFGDQISSNFSIRGNFGFRYVEYDYSSIAPIRYPLLDRESLGDEVAAFIPEDDFIYADESFDPAQSVQGTKDSKVLPSLNVSFIFNEDYYIRLSASKALFFPDLASMTAAIEGGVTPTIIREDPNDTSSPVTDVILNYTLGNVNARGTGNPNIVPEEANQIDLAFEWYFSDVGSLSATFFDKQIDHTFRRGFYQADLTNNGVTRRHDGTGAINSSNAKLQGIEFAYQQSFDHLPGLWSGLGAQFNYTWIDGSGAEDPAGSGDFPIAAPGASEGYGNYTGLPLEGLSEHTYNVIGFYEHDRFDVRFAYNWRSEFLVNSRDVIGFTPIYNEDTGQLDASMNFQVLDQLKIGLEFNNLLDETTKTLFQVNQQGVPLTPRNYFKNDRRIALTVSGSF